MIKYVQEQKMKLNLPNPIETERLVLKKHTLDKEYVQLWVDSINQNLPWLSRFLPHFNKPITFDEEKAFLRSLICGEKENNYGVWNKKTNELMGSIGAFNFEEKESKKSIELGLILFEKFAGHSYGPEATKAFESALFDAGIDSTILKIDSENIRSRRAAEKEGHIWDGKEIMPKKNHPEMQLLVYRKMKAK